MDLPADRDAGQPEATADLGDQLVADEQALTFAFLPLGDSSGGPGAGSADAGASGIASYARIDEATGQVEIAGVLLARSMQRTRAATEAIGLLARHAFDDLGYRRLEWKCDSLNEPSRRAAARLGFTYEGRFRHHMVIKGRNRDTDWFSITDDDWPDIRAAQRALARPRQLRRRRRPARLPQRADRPAETRGSAVIVRPGPCG